MSAARSHCAICGEDCTDAEHALTREQGAERGIDADTAAVCLGCLRGIYAARDAREQGAKAVAPLDLAARFFDRETIIAAEDLDGATFVVRELSAGYCQPWRCGYVVFAGDPMPDIGNAEMHGSWPVHGGVTFDRVLRGDRALGWDYSHYCDVGPERLPAMDAIRAEARALIAFVRSGAWREVSA